MLNTALNVCSSQFFPHPESTKWRFRLFLENIFPLQIMVVSGSEKPQPQFFKTMMPDDGFDELFSQSPRRAMELYHEHIAIVKSVMIRAKPTCLS